MTSTENNATPSAEGSDPASLGGCLFLAVLAFLLLGGCATLVSGDSSSSDLPSGDVPGVWDQNDQEVFEREMQDICATYNC